MTQFKRLLRNKEFIEVYNKGISIADRFLVLYYLPRNHKSTRFGFSLGKNIGKAVKRNRMKRIMREICRTNIHQIKDGYDCIIIVRPRSVGEKYHTLQNSLLRLARKAKLIRKEMQSGETSDNNSN